MGPMKDICEFAGAADDVAAVMNCGMAGKLHNQQLLTASSPALSDGSGKLF
jgi:hypothetical protein